MKQKDQIAQRASAKATLAWLGLNVRRDFHQLNTHQVESLAKAAKAVRYSAPKNANGSTARYFFARLVRHATMKIEG